MTAGVADLTQAAPQAPRIPFPGLDAFAPEEAVYFFGRERDQKVITTNLEASPLTLLYGASGVGKSSILMASVVRGLRVRAIKNADTRRDPSTPARFAVTVIRDWIADPLPRLMEQLRAAATEALGGEELEPWQAGEPPTERLHQWTQRVRFLYVVLDQFEEYFLYHAASDADGTFDVEFPRMVNDPQLRVHFLLSLREDALALLDRFKPRIPRLYGNYLRIDHLDLAAAKQAITGPVARYNELYGAADGEVLVDDDLVAELLSAPELRAHRVLAADTGVALPAADGGKPQIETPYLQLVLRRLWMAMDRESHGLHVKTLRDLGGPQKIIQAHLEEAMDALTPEEQDVAADLFRFLVTPSKTKVAHSVEALADFTGRPEAEIRTVLYKLWAGKRWIVRRIVPPGDAGAEDDSRLLYEIFHDVLAEPILVWRTRKLAARREREEREAAERALAEARETARRERRRSMVFLGLAIGAVLALVAAVIVGVLAVRANDKVHSQRLAASAIEELQSSPEAATREALDALKTSGTPEAQSALRKALPAIRVRAIIPSRGWAMSAALAGPGGRYAFVVNRADGRTRVWDWQTRREVAVLPGRAGAVTALEGGSRVFVTAASGYGGAIWDVAACARGSCVRIGSLPSATTVSANGEVTASSGFRSVNTEPATKCAGTRHCRGRATLRIGGDTADFVTASALSSDGSHLAVGTAYGRFLLWDLRHPSRPPTRTRSGDVRKIDQLTFSPDGRKVAAVSAKIVRVWNVSRCAASPGTRCPLIQIDQHPDWVYAARFSPDSNRLVTTSGDGAARVWQLQVSGSTPQVELRGHRDVILDAGFAPNSDYLITASADGTARVWDARTGLALRGGRAWVNSARFDSGGNFVVAAGDDGFVRVYERNGAHPGRPVETIRDLYIDLPVHYAEFNPRNNNQLVTADDLGYVRLWDRASCRKSPFFCYRELPEARGGTVAEQAVFSPDGKLVAAAKDFEGAEIFDVTTRKGRSIASFAAGAEGVRSVAFSPDGKHLVTGSLDRRARVWDVSGCRPGGAKCNPKLERELPHPAIVWSAVFSPDGNSVATTANDGIVRIWDWRDKHAAPQLLTGATSNIGTVAFSSDGSRLVGGGTDGITDVWDVQSHRLLAAMRMHGGAVESAQFDPKDKSKILSASDDGSAEIYACATCGSLSAVRHEANEELAVVRQPARWLPSDRPKKGR